MKVERRNKQSWLTTLLLDKLSLRAGMLLYIAQCSLYIAGITLPVPYQGHPTERLGKLSVRKALNPLQFSEGNFHLELS